MANKSTHGMSAKALQDAVSAKQITKADAIDRAKTMLAREGKGDGFYARWQKVLKALNAGTFAKTATANFYTSDSPKSKAKPKASVTQSVASLSKAELVEIVQRFMNASK